MCWRPGERHTVREFVEKAFSHIGRKLIWQGTGRDERGIDAGDGRVLVEVDARYFRPTEVDILVGDAQQSARKTSLAPQDDI